MPFAMLDRIIERANGRSCAFGAHKLCLLTGPRFTALGRVYYDPRTLISPVPSVQYVNECQQNQAL
jgi:hypothetical protein